MTTIPNAKKIVGFLFFMFMASIFWATPASAACVRSLEQTLAELGRTLPGTTIIVANVTELVNAVNQANAAGGNRTILLKDGTYTLSDTLVITKAQIAVRSLSGNRDAVILRGQGMAGSVPHIFLVQNSNFTVADVTLGWVRNHGIQIQGEHNADAPLIHNVRFVDTYEQMLKVSYTAGNSTSSDNGIVEWSLFEYSAGVGPQYYIGGIDAHQAHNWIVRHNVFNAIRSPGRSLAEHAIHFWSESSNTLVEQNVIVNSDRGIGFGMGDDGHVGGIIRNNMVYTTRDVGIGLENSSNTAVYNNTVFTANYMDSIEYRFARTSGGAIINNLTNAAIESRDGGTANVQANVTNAQAAWFVNPTMGDLHLASAIPTVVDHGQTLPTVTQDIDCENRPQGRAYDIGADEIGAPAPTQYTLTVNTVGSGSVTLNPAGGTYASGATVQLTAVPATGWVFSGWSGDLSGNTNPATVTMTGNKTVTATFVQQRYTLTVNTVGSGSVTLNPAGGTYVSGATVQLTAVPATGWVFSGWSGDLSGNTNPATVTMTGNKTVTATFVQQRYTLTVNTVGSGSVTLNPAGGTYVSGATVQLTAVPATGWVFSGWSGDLSGNTNPATVTMTGNKTVTATFVQQRYTLTVNTVGSGSVTLNPAGGTYVSGATVQLTAVPATGWVFSGWSGDLSGNTNPATVTMTGNKTVTATFVQQRYTLTVNTVGSGSVTLNPAGGTYVSSATVQLTAVPATGWVFSGWSGDLSGNTNPATLTMTGNKTVTATFVQQRYTLTVNTVGSGSVTLNPAGGTYASGATVQLTAVPATGWVFSGWSGDLSGNTNPATVTMTGNKTVTASFGAVNISKEQQFTDRGGNTVWNGDTISYRITLQNLFDQAVNLLISDALSALVSYVQGSFTVNGSTATPTLNGDLLGYAYDYLGVGQTLNLAFDVTVNDKAPLDGMITNAAAVNAYFIGATNPIIFNKVSNFVQAQVKSSGESPVPEPSTLVLLGVGLFGLGGLARKHLRRK